MPGLFPDLAFPNDTQGQIQSLYAIVNTMEVKLSILNEILSEGTLKTKAGKLLFSILTDPKQKFSRLFYTSQ